MPEIQYRLSALVCLPAPEQSLYQYDFCSQPDNNFLFLHPVYHPAGSSIHTAAERNEDFVILLGRLVFLHELICAESSLKAPGCRFSLEDKQLCGRG